MPVWLRRFHIKKIQKYYEDLKNRQEQNQSSPKKIPRPGITPK